MTACTTQVPTSVTTPAPVTTGGSTLSETALIEHMNEVTLAILARDPEWMTDLGIAETNERLTPISTAYRSETVLLASGALGELPKPHDGLSSTTNLSLETLRWWLQDIVTGAGFELYDYPVSFITGAHVNLPEYLVDIHPLVDRRDGDDYLARLTALGSKIDWVVESLREAEQNDILMPERVRQIAVWQVGEFLRLPAGRQSLITEFERRLALTALDEDERANLVERATGVVADQVIPAYRRLQTALDEAATRTSVGVWDLPDGDDYYRWVLRHHTTVDTTPEELHEWGLGEVERVRSDLTSALAELGYDTDDLAVALTDAIADAGSVDLSTEPARTAFLDRNRQLVEEALEATSDWFGLAPQADLVIRRPEPTREGGAGAYYRGPDLSGRRPGIYYLSMGADSRPAHNYRTTTYHEGVPGHHLQLALQSQLDNPLHQRAVTFTGFAEGWALYAERLAWEAGMYEADPYGNVGRLQMELLRAVRVVVDTGIHAMRWNREQAIEYHVVTSGFSRAGAEAEVDRYIVWPGQAPAYLVGMSAILAARQEVIDRLGDGFVMADFHDVVLGHGSLPLSVLATAVPDLVVGRRAR